MTYQAESENLFHTKGPEILRGGMNLPEPPFDERHPEFMQWLRAVLCVLQTAGVVWPVLGRFGLRRRYSQRTETILTIFAAVNLGCALMWGYQFFTNLGAD
jgi:hypothetical protein